jgi:hypothetical protein
MSGHACGGFLSSLFSPLFSFADGQHAILAVCACNTRASIGPCVFVAGHDVPYLFLSKLEDESFKHFAGMREFTAVSPGKPKKLDVRSVM